MKKILHTLLITVALTLGANHTYAQAWEKNTKTLSLGFGASQFFHLDDYYYYGRGQGPGPGFHNWYTPLTGQINFQGEFGIHKYWGLGFTTGIGGRGGMRYDYAGELNIPIGMIANFHFYQLIANKSKKNIHADKLDIYVGASLGSGLAFTYYPGYSRVVPMAFGGLHAGIRYYFTPKVGVNGELGWGKSLVNVGFVFKL